MGPVNAIRDRQKQIKDIISVHVFIQLDTSTVTVTYTFMSSHAFPPAFPRKPPLFWGQVQTVSTFISKLFFVLTISEDLSPLLPTDCPQSIWWSQCLIKPFCQSCCYPSRHVPPVTCLYPDMSGDRCLHLVHLVSICIWSPSSLSVTFLSALSSVLMSQIVPGTRNYPPSRCHSTID